MAKTVHNGFHNGFVIIGVAESTRALYERMDNRRKLNKGEVNPMALNTSPASVGVLSYFEIFTGDSNNLRKLNPES